jgi:predicted nucleic acid-binding protein
MAAAYFDTSVFLAVLAKQPEAAKVKSLLDELRADKVRIYTSILTLQEVSVSSFLHSQMFVDHHEKLAALARITGVTKEIAMTAAKFEAAILMDAKKSPQKGQVIVDNRRRKFDCFHIATALAHNCSRFYAFDAKFENRCRSLGLSSLLVLTPEPHKPSLPFTGSAVGQSPPR